MRLTIPQLAGPQVVLPKVVPFFGPPEIGLFAGPMAAPLKAEVMLDMKPYMKVHVLPFKRLRLKAVMTPILFQMLTKIGGWIRKTAQRSIRPAKKTSPPGRPPHSHVGTLRHKIFYAVDRFTESVVIGPVMVNTRATMSGAKAVKALEYGGPSIVKGRREWFRHRWIRMRPYMRPALAKALASVDEILAEFRR